ncbi:MAG: phosphate/phosphite/phosphonate ABC transporter substrate-binding protein [Desulfobacterales bacterium]|nr:phosphate/phosphite/phosphonate ABC transporter substrate-binding protein [Desulfobacterales bacterium]
MVLCVLAVGCDSSEPAYKVDLSQRETPRIQQETQSITYAYLPQYSHSVSYQKHHRLVDYLARTTGLKIRQIFPDTFDGHMKMVGQGKIDLSFTNPYIYVQTANRYGSAAFARIVEKEGGNRYRGQIICRADNPRIQSLADCRDKRWIAVDPGSGGGYLFPLTLFYAHGIMRKDFQEIAFAPGPGGKQEKVVLAVAAGKYDIGTIRQGTLDVVAGKIDPLSIRVLAATAWYPGWVFSSRRGLDPDLVAKVKNVLLALDIRRPDHQPILQAAQFVSVISSVDADYDPVREAAQIIGVSLSQ